MRGICFTCKARGLSVPATCKRRVDTVLQRVCDACAEALGNVRYTVAGLGTEARHAAEAEVTTNVEALESALSTAEVDTAHSDASESHAARYYLTAEVYAAIVKRSHYRYTVDTVRDAYVTEALGLFVRYAGQMIARGETVDTERALTRALFGSTSERKRLADNVLLSTPVAGGTTDGLSESTQDLGARIASETADDSGAERLYRVAGRTFTQAQVEAMAAARGVTL